MAESKRKYSEGSLIKELWENVEKLFAKTQYQPFDYMIYVISIIFIQYCELINKENDNKTQIKITNNSKNSNLINLVRAKLAQQIAKHINESMKELMNKNVFLKELLPTDFDRIENSILVNLLTTFEESQIAKKFHNVNSELYQRIINVFLDRFTYYYNDADKFSTPKIIRMLLIGILEPKEGKIYDPGCGIGSMFTECFRYSRKKGVNINRIRVFGQEKMEIFSRLCKIHLFLYTNNIEIEKVDTLRYDEFETTYDYVLANPPLNKKIKSSKDTRFIFGNPKSNSNLAWIQIIFQSLNSKGRSGFLMANGINTKMEKNIKEIRMKLIKSKSIDVLISIKENFSPISIPFTLWIIDKGKIETKRANSILFIDTDKLTISYDRNKIAFDRDQSSFINSITRLYRDQTISSDMQNTILYQKYFSINEYQDIPGICRKVSIQEIEQNNWLLNPKKYVGFQYRSIKNDKKEFNQNLRNFLKELKTTEKKSNKLTIKINKAIDYLLE